jgi:choline dehydrogenase-like flavoprotein
VLLLEAGGPDNHLYLKMPLAFLKAMPHPAFNWTYWTEPEPHLDGRRMPLPRGKGDRRSGSINGMFAMRGHPLDYDQWAQMGASGWSYADVLPYFRKSEDSWRGEGPYHGAAAGARAADRFAVPAARRDDGDRTSRRLCDHRRPRRRASRGLRARRADGRPERTPGQRGDRVPQAGNRAAEPRRALGSAGPAVGVRG